MTQTPTTSCKSSSKVSLRAPQVAWLTLGLFFFCLGVSVAGVALVLLGWMPMWLGFVTSSIAAFIAFTPAHDASHKSVARSRWVNEVVGRVSAILLIAPFGAFRYMHLEHHKHTNDEHKDPDYWSGAGPTWLLPLRWLSQDLHYYYLYVKAWQERPVAERRETLGTIVLLWSVVIGLCSLGYAWPVLMLWVLPARLAIACLSYGFDYLPHKPHQIKSSEDRYKATVIRPHPLLTLLLIYQNYHLIHHLYPGVPFYRYAEIWRAKRDELLAKGVELRDLHGHVMTAEGMPETP